jgi:hypothetical protein
MPHAQIPTASQTSIALALKQELLQLMQRQKRGEFMTTFVDHTVLFLSVLRPVVLVVLRLCPYSGK